MSVRTCLILLALAPSTLLAKETILIEEAPIREVTVFRDGALVTRSFEMDLSEGLSILRLPRVPRSADPSFLQVQLSKEANGRILEAAMLRPKEDEPRQVHGASGSNSSSPR